MFTKLFIVCAVVAMATAAEYPPGVHPAICPNYPFCDMTLMAKYAPNGSPLPEWIYKPSILPALPPGQVPAYPYVYSYAIIPSAPPAPATEAPTTTEASVIPEAPMIPEAPISLEAARYPADFNPALCPNYPYCF